MRRALPALLAFLCSGMTLWAFMPPYATDDTLVARSDAIVEGHVEAGFTVIGPFPKAEVPAADHVFEYQTILVVTKVLHGQLPLGPTPLIIHHGLLPVVLDAKTPVAQLMGEGLPKADELTGPLVPVGLFYPSTCIGMPPTPDIRKDQIWFLRKSSLNPPDASEDTSALGVRWQQDVQPLEREGYFRAILSGDPEALTPFAQGDSWQAQQARICQDRLRVQKLDGISDLELQASALVAFMEGEAPFSSASRLAMDKLAVLGPLGLKKLMPMFQNADHGYDRRAILQAWEGANYGAAGPVLQAWLNQENQWWAQQGAQNMIWSFQVGQKGGPEYNDPRAVSNRNVYCTVEALGGLGGPEAKAVIAATRTQWAALSVRPAPGNDIVAMCDQTLSQLH